MNSTITTLPISPYVLRPAHVLWIETDSCWWICSVPGLTMPMPTCSLPGTNSQSPLQVIEDSCTNFDWKSMRILVPLHWGRGHTEVQAIYVSKLCILWLLTPIFSPPTAGEQWYNSAHTRTHTIKQTFGVLKSCFCSISFSGKILRYSLVNTADIILECCVLYNMATHASLKVEVEGAVGDNMTWLQQKWTLTSHKTRCGRGWSKTILSGENMYQHEQCDWFMQFVNPLPIWHTIVFRIPSPCLHNDKHSNSQKRKLYTHGCVKLVWAPGHLPLHVSGYSMYGVMCVSCWVLLL